MSYNGGIDFGLLGDYDAMEDVEMLATGLTESLERPAGRRRGGRRALAGEPCRARRPAGLTESSLPSA